MTSQAHWLPPYRSGPVYRGQRLREFWGAAKSSTVDWCSRRYSDGCEGWMTRDVRRERIAASRERIRVAVERLDKKNKKEKKMAKKYPVKPLLVEHTVEIVEGVCGLSIYLNGYRIVGDKPWGGGRLVKSWTLSDDDLKEATKRASRTSREGR